MPALRSNATSEAWRALLIAFTGIHHQLAAEMEEAFGLPIEDYEVLLMLYEAGDRGLRPSEIAEKRRLSRSGATRLVDRLVNEGFVERKECGDDRRGSVVSLTARGRQTFTRAGRLHLDGIDRHVGSRLSASEAIELQRLLAKLTDEPSGHDGSGD